MATQAIYLKALKQIGSEWQKGAMHRIYFNGLAKWYGLEVELYNSGNISAAWLDGESISNGRAKALDTTLRYGKVWYDVSAAKFVGQNLEQPMINKIVAAIKAKVEGIVTELDEQEICR